MFSDVILRGQKQTIKMHVTDVTSHLWFSSPQLCKTVIIYAYKAHKHKTLCFIKLSQVTCASEENNKHNSTLLRILQAEKYAP